VSIRWTTPAVEDLTAIRDFIEERNPAAAIEVVERVFDAIEALEATPSRGRPGRRPGTRELVLTDVPYIVAYRVTAGTIEVLRVLHASRRWPRRLH
jgi:toxin ParE1/3/4